MKNILILGSLPHEQDRRDLYHLMVGVCQNYASQVKSPIDTLEFDGTGRERYERAFRLIGEADLIIGEQSLPSTGQGMEIREAENLGKPILVVAREGSKVSGLVRESPNVEHILFYNSPENLKIGLDSFLESFRAE